MTDTDQRRYTTFGSEVERYAYQVKSALAQSSHMSNALWLNGRRDRNAADFFMIYEYAVDEFGGPKAIAAALDVSDNDITRLRSSANNLAPVDGGRHATANRTAEWGLDPILFRYATLELVDDADGAARLDAGH